MFKRINIPYTSSSPAGLIEANTIDPWSQAGKYAAGWTYFCIILMVIVLISRIYHFWTDKLRQALYKDQAIHSQLDSRNSPESDLSSSPNPSTTTYAEHISKHDLIDLTAHTYQHSTSSISIVNDTIALFRWIFYRPIPEYRRHRLVLSLPSLAVTCVIIIATTFVMLYCLLPRPLYWQSIRYGSPPLAIRAGMLSVAMTPWIVATATKGNLISLVTGISHERLGVFHRWGAYLCTLLAVMHMVPFYVQPVWKDGGLTVFTNLISVNGIVYSTGICVFVPLCWLVIGSLPPIRHYFHEVFLVLHIPVSLLYVALLFWHTQNHLSSWAYLFATCAIWVVTSLIRAYKLNWLKPWQKPQWLAGDECSITLMAENAIKITIPTRMRWKPGQFVYLRIPSISYSQNHPFTISSLCADDFPSEYGADYRDCVIVFRPFSGFTKKVLEEALDNLPRPYIRPKTYRAFLEGPYGGMTRELPAFDTVIMFAGGSGITAVVSQLLSLVKRMRDEKAVTRKVVVVWALKDLGALEWFKEELRICVESAPAGSVSCSFYVTGKSQAVLTGDKCGGVACSVRSGQIEESSHAPRSVSPSDHDELDGFVSGVAEKRFSALIRDEARHDPSNESILRAEEEDAITSLPRSRFLQNSLPPVYRPSTRLTSYAINSADSNTFQQDMIPVIQAAYTPKQHVSPASISPNTTKSLANQYPPPTRRPPKIQTQFTHRPMSLSSSIQSTGTPIYKSTPRDPTSEMSQFQALAKSSPEVLRPPYRRPLSLQIPKSSLAPYISPYSSQAQLNQAKTRATRPNPTFLQPLPSRDDPPLRTSQNPSSQFSNLSPPPYQIHHSRPDLAALLHQLTNNTLPYAQNILGRRTCIFVCGPSSMRVGVAGAVARLQADIWGDEAIDEVFLWTENYSV